jgi:hypothetical protein
MLENYLPKALVNGPNIYAILSKGLHELTEDECKLHFPVVKSGIEIILDEEIEMREKEMREKKLRDDIGSINLWC